MTPMEKEGISHKLKSMVGLRYVQLMHGYHYFLHLSLVCTLFLSIHFFFMAVTAYGEDDEGSWDVNKMCHTNYLLKSQPGIAVCNITMADDVAIERLYIQSSK